MEKGQGKRMDTLQTDKVFTRKEYIEREAVFDALFGQYCGSFKMLLAGGTGGRNDG